MSWQEELCIISGDNRSWEQNNISKVILALKKILSLILKGYICEIIKITLKK